VGYQPIGLDVNRICLSWCAYWKKKKCHERPLKVLKIINWKIIDKNRVHVWKGSPLLKFQKGQSRPWPDFTARPILALNHAHVCPLFESAGSSAYKRANYANIVSVSRSRPTSTVMKETTTSVLLVAITTTIIISNSCCFQALQRSCCH